MLVTQSPPVGVEHQAVGKDFCIELHIGFARTKIAIGADANRDTARHRSR